QTGGQRGDERCARTPRAGAWPRPRRAAESPGRVVKLGGPLGIALAVVAAIAGVARGDPVLVALTASGALLVFAADRPEAATRIPVHGVPGTLIGIDLRPADQQLYGVPTTNEIYRIHPKSGEDPALL